MRICAMLCVCLLATSGCGSKKKVEIGLPKEVPVEPEKPLPAPPVPPVVLKKPATTPEPEVTAEPARKAEPAEPPAPVAPAAAMLRSGFEKRGAELRAGALLVTDTTHVERWTFDTNGIWLNCRANGHYGGRKNALNLCGKSAWSYFSEDDQKALKKALEAAFAEKVSVEKQAWTEGEHFDFRAEAASETLWVVNLRCRQKALEESLFKAFAAEYAANAKYRSESSDSATPNSRGEYTLKGKNMDLR